MILSETWTMKSSDNLLCRTGVEYVITAMIAWNKKGFRRRKVSRSVVAGTTMNGNDGVNEVLKPFKSEAARPLSTRPSWIGSYTSNLAAVIRSPLQWPTTVSSTWWIASLLSGLTDSDAEVECADAGLVGWWLADMNSIRLSTRCSSCLTRLLSCKQSWSGGMDHYHH